MSKKPKSVTNTEKLDPLLLLAGIAARGQGPAIEFMEARGQEEFVASAVLPVDLRPSPEAFEEAGFKLGDAVEGDPLFRAVELPPGWTRKATDHSMWSHIVDEQGRKRVSVFYKAAFYDRNAHARIEPASLKREEDGG